MTSNQQVRRMAVLPASSGGSRNSITELISLVDAQGTPIDLNSSGNSTVETTARPSFSTIPNAVGVGAFTRLLLTTYDGSGVGTHPSVLYVPSGWNGYKWLMGFTPYPGEDPDFENPSLLVSHNGEDWFVQPGHTNPVEPFPGALSYNSDTNLVLANDGTLYLFWRTFRNSSTNKEEILYKKTTDGISWSDRVKIIENDHTVSRPVSPAFVQHTDDTWSVFTVDILASPNTVNRQDAPTVDGPWSTPVEVQGLVFPSGKEAWHIEVKIVDDEYVMVIDDTNLGVSGQAGRLHIATSTDGLTFRTSPTAFPSPGLHYKSSVVPSTINGQPGFRVYYSSIGEVGFADVIFSDSVSRPDSPEKMMAASGLAIPYVFGDRFNRADQSMTATPSDSGVNWTIIQGDWVVSDRRMKTTVNSNGRIVFDAGTPDVHMGFNAHTTPSDGGGQVWIMARVVDGNNFIRFGSTGGVWKLEAYSGGALVVDQSSTFGKNLIANDYLEVKTSGDSVTGLINGFEVIQFDISTHNTATQFGMQTNRAETQIDNVWAKAL